MTITEWFARAVAAGLMPECNYAFAEYSKSWHGVEEWSIYTGITENCKDTILIRNIIENPEDEDARVFLRKDGKDLYSLEWRKPTEQDIGKMCWFYDKDEYLFKALLNSIKKNVYCISFLNGTEITGFNYCILADHGNICPNVEDFKE